VGLLFAGPCELLLQFAVVRLLCRFVGRRFLTIQGFACFLISGGVFSGARFSGDPSSRAAGCSGGPGGGLEAACVVATDRSWGWCVSCGGCPAVVLFQGEICCCAGVSARGVGAAV